MVSGGPGDYSSRPRYLYQRGVDPRRYDLDPRPTIRNARYESGRGWTRVGLQYHQHRSQRLIGWLTAFGLDERDRARREEERRRSQNALLALEALREAFIAGHPIDGQAETKPIQMRGPRRAG